MIAVADEGQVDAVLIAGDIFDRAVPPPEAVTLLDDVLYRLVIDLRIPVVMIAGNHDSPRRLGFGARMLQPQGLSIHANVETSLKPLELQDEHGPVHVYAIPYAEPPVVSHALGVSVHSHHSAMASVLDNLRFADGVRSLLMGHLFLQGGAETESERPLTVGTLEGVSPELFTSFCYTALGHLHRPQSWNNGKIRYCGSLMRMSFDEVDHDKSVTLVELDEKGEITTETVTLTPLRQVVRVKGFLKDLLSAEPTQDFTSVELLDQGAVLDAAGQLRDVFPQLCEVTRPHITRDGNITSLSVPRPERQTGELFADFFEAMTGDPLPDPERRSFEAAYRAFSAKEQETVD